MWHKFTFQFDPLSDPNNRQFEQAFKECVGQDAAILRRDRNREEKLVYHLSSEPGQTCLDELIRRFDGAKSEQPDENNTLLVYPPEHRVKMPEK